MNIDHCDETPIGKDILAQVGPIEKLLGSVSYSETDGVDGKNQQLRTSARVFKKMKFDSIQPPQPEKKDKKEEPKPEEVKHEIKKPVNPVWNSEEKKMFFEALNEYGKDFESIHLSLSTRLKKKGIADDLIKTKHQIRHFYYKTFHMLMCCLKFPEWVPKNAQELYTLINYGEIRRKIGSVSKKNWSKLNELIYRGSIALRIKGKTIRIKTPMCRALRRLNQLDEKYDDLKLPTRVCVELKPKNMVSFLKVQGMAQNPRIKLSLSLQKRLSSLITCISLRWKSTDAVIYDRALVSTNVATKDCVPSQKVIEESSALLSPLLRVTPPLTAHIDLPSVDISEYFTGQSICLNAFEVRKGVKFKHVVIDELKKEEKEEPSAIKTDKSPSKSAEEPANLSGEMQTSVTEVVDEAVNTILLLQSPKEEVPHLTPSFMNSIAGSSSSGTSNPKIEEVKDVKDVEMKVTMNQEQIEEIRQGWTIENCGCLTVGEIYLMFGSASKLLLEYSWDDPPRLENDESPDKTFSNSLSRLVSLAKLQSEKILSNKCTCGHVCGAKTNVQFKKPLPVKILKKNQGTQEPAITEDDTQTKTQTPITVEDTFQVPDSPMVDLISQLDTMQRLNPKCGKGRRRGTKQLVVERNLVPTSSVKNHQLVSMNIISQETAPKHVEAPLGNSGAENVTDTTPANQRLLDGSGLLSAGLPNHNNNEKMDTESCENFTSLLSDQQRSNSSTGISKILKESDCQWLNTEVSDYSLSSLLGHLDGPSKNSQTNMSTDDTELPQDVDAQISTLLIEASVDYTAKFADLAAQVTDTKK